MNNGLEDVVAAETVLSDVRGVEGQLIIRGYPLVALAGRWTFEQTAHLLFTGFFDDLPDAAEFAARLGAARVNVFEQTRALLGPMSDACANVRHPRQGNASRTINIIEQVKRPSRALQHRWPKSRFHAPKLQIPDSGAGPPGVHHGSFEFEERRFVRRWRFDDQQPQMHGLRDQMRPVPGVQFQSYILDMPFDGSRRDVYLYRDLLGRAAHCDQFQYLMFTKGQMRFDVQSVLMHGAIP